MQGDQYASFVQKFVIDNGGRLHVFRASFCDPIDDTTLKEEYEKALNDALAPDVAHVDIKFANDDVSSAAVENSVTKKLLPSFEHQLPSATTCRQATKIVTAFLQTYKSFASEIASKKKELADAEEAFTAASEAHTAAEDTDDEAPLLRRVQLADQARATASMELNRYLEWRTKTVNDFKQVVVDYCNGATLKVVAGKRKVGEGEVVDEELFGEEALDAEATTLTKEAPAKFLKSNRCRRSSSLLTWLTGTSYSQKHIVQHLWRVSDFRSPEALYADFPALCKKVKAVGGAFYFQKAAVNLWQSAPEATRMSTRERLGFVGDYADWAEKIVELTAREADPQ